MLREVFSEFTAEMENLLTQKAEELEKTVLPRLKENFIIYHKNLQTIINVLVKKSLIHEDPYKYDQKISDLEIPETGPILESEKTVQLSIRFSNFESQLDYLNQYYQFNLEFLDFKRLKMLSALAGYIKWDKALTRSEDHISFHFFELAGKLQAEADNLSFRVISTSRQDLTNRYLLIQEDIKELSAYHREHYKQQVRREVLSRMDLPTVRGRFNYEPLVIQAKKMWTAAFPGKPLYGELFNEIFSELFGPEAEGNREKLLARFGKGKAQGGVKKKPESFRRLLDQGLAALGEGGAPLQRAVEKLSGNLALIEKQKKSLGNKFKSWIKGGKESGFIMDLEVFEEKSNLSKPLHLNFTLFAESALKEAKALQALTAAETGPQGPRLKALTDQALFDYFLERTAQAQKNFACLTPIETFLKNEAGPGFPEELSSIAEEAGAFKAAILAANKKRFDYAARIEEQAQLKKLGLA